MEFEIKMQMEFQCKHFYARIWSGLGKKHCKIEENMKKNNRKGKKGLQVWNVSEERTDLIYNSEKKS